MRLRDFIQGHAKEELERISRENITMQELTQYLIEGYWRRRSS